MQLAPDIFRSGQSVTHQASPTGRVHAKPYKDLGSRTKEREDIARPEIG